jgi:hypothetical protein
MEYIKIDKDLIPYEFDIALKDETFKFMVKYNSLNDFFTIDLYKNDEVIILGEKLVYGKPLFLSCLHKSIPKVYILPYDISSNTDRITYENLGEQVFLYLVEDDEDGTL